MENKKCNGCGLVKPVSEFGKEARAKNGYKPRCKECYNAYYNLKYPSFKEKKIEAANRRYTNKRDELLLKSKDYSRRPDVKIKKFAYGKKYREENLQYLKAKANEREKFLVKTNLEYRLIKNHRKLIYNLKIAKTGRTKEMLGYGKDELIFALGRLPELNESIDHKIPVTWFIKDTPIKIINSLLNLQILTRSENSKKGNSFCHPVSKEFLQQCLPFIKPIFKTKIYAKQNSLEKAI